MKKGDRERSRGTDAAGVGGINEKVRKRREL